MPSEAKETQLPLSPQELAATVEALHDAVLRRLSWSVTPDFVEWRELPVKDVQVIIDKLVSAYIKSMMAWKEAEFEKAPDYESHFSLPQEVWDALASVTTAITWDDVPLHTADGCPMCKKFMR